MPYTPNPHRCADSTTARDSYRAWPAGGQPPPPASVPLPTNPHKFDDTTTSKEAYQPWSLPPQTPAGSVPYTPNPHRCADSTTARDSYRAMQLPVGFSPPLGLLTKGGSFHCVLPSGTQPPARATAVFTTVVHNQTEVAIKVVAVVGEEPHHLLLGSFMLVRAASLAAVAPSPPRPPGHPDASRRASSAPAGCVTHRRTVL